ncbi:MAG: preprotein translocase subunit SecE [Candidatus Tagabacteria bacterium RIFCSPLOWO2_01_FULL_39_11]|uniref:Protein translocase subunit SecE n=1 Tax=Candidatus Tagabacteria bacterium RIFCSPLOWO2_01_FULL_39_11 TaxID=1802295 RepID=A0A1G2LS06_9BACT|nr:MAG: preprotein translocase subunit SecE [Candidatus Tagabacteria bacterium RIFCSPLOWO2_01_FULL_39_11]
MARLINYFKLSRLELKHVNWPARKATARFTFLVIGISAIIAAFLGFLDIIFQYFLNNFVL